MLKSTTPSAAITPAQREAARTAFNAVMGQLAEAIDEVGRPGDLLHIEIDRSGMGDPDPRISINFVVHRPGGSRP